MEEHLQNLSEVSRLGGKRFSLHGRRMLARSMLRRLKSCVVLDEDVRNVMPDVHSQFICVVCMVALDQLTTNTRTHRHVNASRLNSPTRCICKRASLIESFHFPVSNKQAAMSFGIDHRVFLFR